MKSQYIISCSILSSLLKSEAQSIWHFPIAFEDATGAKDTIWCIWDTTATINWSPGPYDTLLNEGPAISDYNVFNVWVYNNNGDSTKTLANPYSTTIGFTLPVRAFNYQYPIAISWDTSLFYSPLIHQPVGYINYARIDNGYFFGVNNNPPAQMFDMTLDNHVLAPWFPWGSQDQFPMSFYIWGDQNIGLSEINNNKQIVLRPNPFYDHFAISSNVFIKQIELFSIHGQILFSKTVIENNLNSVDLLLPFLSKGLYIVKIANSQNQVSYEKLIKD